MDNNITATALKYSALLALATIPAKRLLSQKQLEEINLLLNSGFLVMFASFPLGLWVLSRWPKNPLLLSGILTGLAFVIREHMVTVAERKELPGEHRGDSLASTLT